VFVFVCISLSLVLALRSAGRIHRWCLRVIIQYKRTRIPRKRVVLRILLRPAPNKLRRGLETTAARARTKVSNTICFPWPRLVGRQSYYLIHGRCEIFVDISSHVRVLTFYPTRRCYRCCEKTRFESIFRQAHLHSCIQITDNSNDSV